jgi:hypothetical protein
MLGSGMSLRLVALCVDANDPVGLVRFWAEALRWEVADEAAEEIRLLPTDGGPNRLHLDLTSTSLDDQRDSVARLTQARRAPHRHRAAARGGPRRAG